MHSNLVQVRKFAFLYRKLEVGKSSKFDKNFANLRISSAFDPMTEDLRGTSKKSTKTEVSRSPYFLRLVDIFKQKKLREIWKILSKYGGSKGEILVGTGRYSRLLFPLQIFFTRRVS